VNKIERISFLILFSMISAGLIVGQNNVNLSSFTMAGELPESDGIIFLSPKRVLTEAGPKIFKDSTRYATLTAQVEKLKTATGIDARQIDRLAVAVKAVNTPSGGVKPQYLVIAEGGINAASLVAAGKLAARGKYSEEKGSGKTLYIFKLDEQLWIPGLMPVSINEVAVSALDSKTFALGSPDSVRSMIYGTNRKKISPDLISLATRESDALITLGAIVPQQLTQSLNFGNDEAGRAIQSVKTVAGWVGTIPTGFDINLLLKASDADAAKNLTDTISALQHFGALIRNTAAKNALGNLKVTQDKEQVHVRTEVSQTDLASLMLRF
jgi:hypothetical protein